MGQNKEEESYEVSIIAGVRLPSQCRAFTGYAEFYALGSQKGNEGVHTVFNSTAQRQYRETSCTCIKEIVVTTNIQVSDVRKWSTVHA